jgi:hypothetical protein
VPDPKCNGGSGTAQKADEEGVATIWVYRDHPVAAGGDLRAPVEAAVAAVAGRPGEPPGEPWTDSQRETMLKESTGVLELHESYCSFRFGCVRMLAGMAQRTMRQSASDYGCINPLLESGRRVELVVATSAGINELHIVERAVMPNFKRACFALFARWMSID